MLRQSKVPFAVQVASGVSVTNIQVDFGQYDDVLQMSANGATISATTSTGTGNTNNGGDSEHDDA